MIEGAVAGAISKDSSRLVDGLGVELSTCVEMGRGDSCEGIVGCDGQGGDEPASDGSTGADTGPLATVGEAPEEDG